MRRLDRPRLRDAIKLLTDEKWSHYEGDDPSTIGWITPENAPSIEQINAKFQELNAAEPMRLLREERNRRIAETDWWASSDLLISDDQRKYRQALRDITKTADPQLNEFDELINVTWPEKP